MQDGHDHADHIYKMVMGVAPCRTDMVPNSTAIWYYYLLIMVSLCSGLFFGKTELPLQGEVIYNMVVVAPLRTDIVTVLNHMRDIEGLIFTTRWWWWCPAGEIL